MCLGFVSELARDKSMQGMDCAQRDADKLHILAMPFPAQGHICPMLQLCKRLASRGLKVTLISLIEKELTKGDFGSVHIESVYDSTLMDDTVSTADEYIMNLKSMASKKLPEVLAKQEMSGYTTRCLVYDSLFPWAQDIARELGFIGASFFTQPCAVDAIYYNVREGKIKIPIQIEQATFSVEGIPPLQTRDLPSFVYDLETYPDALSLMTDQFSNIEQVDWVFINTFNSLEEEVVNWMADRCPIKPIGPLIPNMYLDKRSENDKEYGLSLFKPQIDGCIKWLDSKESFSVVYASFGSISDLGERQMEEVARGLKRSNRHFLWVVRETEENKLPRDFVDETSDRGLVLSWCPQLEVLAHKSIGCFMTHCGWNSTLEALCLGVPMVAMPQWADQTTNAKLVEDLWRVGVRVKVDVDGIVTGEEIETCINEVMEGEKSKEMRKNAEKWKKLAKEAVDEGGSSNKNFEEFVAKLERSSSVIRD